MASFLSGTLERNDWYSALCPNGTLDRGSIGRGTWKGSMSTWWDCGWKAEGGAVGRFVETSCISGTRGRLNHGHGPRGNCPICNKMAKTNVTVKCVNYKRQSSRNCFGIFWRQWPQCWLFWLTDEKKKHRVHVIFQNYNQPAKIDPNKQSLKDAFTSLVWNGVEYISLHIFLENWSQELRSNF